MARLGGVCWNVCDDQWCHIIKLASPGRRLPMSMLLSIWFHEARRSRFGALRDVG
jgi:hypothetical protein